MRGVDANGAIALVTNDHPEWDFSVEGVIAHAISPAFAGHGGSAVRAAKRFFPQPAARKRLRRAIVADVIPKVCGVCLQERHFDGKLALFVVFSQSLP